MALFNRLASHVNSNQSYGTSKMDSQQRKVSQKDLTFETLGGVQPPEEEDLLKSTCLDIIDNINRLQKKELFDKQKIKTKKSLQNHTAVSIRESH